MNVNEYGVVYAFSTGFDMSGFTSISLTITRPDLTTVTVTNSTGVTVPASPIPTTDGVFAANQYTRYVFANGDINQVGNYSARVTYNDGSQHLISDVGTFTINP